MPSVAVLPLSSAIKVTFPGFVRDLRVAVAVKARDKLKKGLAACFFASQGRNLTCLAVLSHEAGHGA